MASKMFSAELKKAALKFLKSIKDKEFLLVGNEANPIDAAQYWRGENSMCIAL